MWLQNRKLTYLSWFLRGLEPTTVPYSWDSQIIRESWHIMRCTGFKKSKGQQFKLCKSLNPFTIPESSFYSSKLNSIHLSFMTALIDSLLNIVTCCYWKDIKINKLRFDFLQWSFFSMYTSVYLEATWSWVFFPAKFLSTPFPSSAGLIWEEAF